MKSWIGLLCFAGLALGTGSAPTVRFAMTAATVGPITTVCPATPTSVSNFPVTATSVFLYFVLDGVQAGDVITASWFDPTSTAYAPAGVMWNMSTAGSFCFETKLDIAGQAPASLPGNWSVQIAANQATLTSLPFAITAVTGLTASIIQVDSSKCPTIMATVTVVDGTGTPVSGLTSANFTLLEDGQARPITVTQVGGGAGLSVSLLLDTSLSTGLARSDIASAAKTLVGLQVPTTAIAVYSFSTSATLLQDFTTNHTLLNSQIDTINLITGGGSTAIFDAVATAIQGLAARPGRRALVLLSDGGDNNSLTTLQGAIQLAQQNSVTIYTVGFYTSDRNDAVLSQLATGTGGLYQPAANNSTDLQRIFQSLGQLLAPPIQYQITYTTASSTVNHTISLTATQGVTSSPAVTQAVNACAAPCSTGLPNPPAGGTDTAPPFGSFDTPLNNTGGVVGAIPVTGWALDNVGVTKVEIYREIVGSEPAGKFGLVFIGTATFVKGARPDVQAAYSTLPNSDRAGWGYMLLTNFLPYSGGSQGPGNGTIHLHAFAYDAAGHTAELGAPGKIIICDNAHAAKPFGSIDTPDQGAAASGTQYLNFGWALTPGANIKIPIDGSTITVAVDGQALGHPVYNQFRNDIATSFPSFTNAQGAVGFFYIDVTKLTGCVHTIGWLVYDDAGRGDGIGSRFFTVSTGPGNVPADDSPVEPRESNEVWLRRGFDPAAVAEPLHPDGRKDYTVVIEELGRIELDAGVSNGYSLANGRLQDLPPGSSFKNGTFYWQLGPGFLGDYTLRLTRSNGEQVPVRVRVLPKTFSAARE